MRCKMPGCDRVATEHWRLIDVCCHCWDELQAESHRYYAKRITADERVLYKKIKRIEGQRR